MARTNSVGQPIARAIVCKLPYCSNVNFDDFVNNVPLIELFDNFQSLIDSLDIESEKGIREYCTGLEPLDNTRFVLTGARSIGSFGYPAESTLSKRVFQIII